VPVDADERDFFEKFMQRHVEITEAQIAAMRRGFDLLQAEIADQREQIQANTRALLSVLDRLEGT
jgi:hypothetical protein